MATRLFWPTIPANFPQGYVLNRDPNGHQLYCARKWPGLPGCLYEPGVLDDMWEMRCLVCAETTVMSGEQLIRLLGEGRVVGHYRDGLVVTGGSDAT